MVMRIFQQGYTPTNIKSKSGIKLPTDSNHTSQRLEHPIQVSRCCDYCHTTSKYYIIWICINYYKNMRKVMETLRINIKKIQKLSSYRNWDQIEMMEWESFEKHQEREGVTVVLVSYPYRWTNLSLNKSEFCV